MCGYCPVLLLLLLLLLCLEYAFAANPREHGKYASPPLSVMFLRIIAEIRTHLLRELHEYRLAIDIFLVSRWRSRASVVFLCYVPVFLLVLAALSLLHQHSRRRFVLSIKIDRLRPNYY